MDPDPLKWLWDGVSDFQTKFNDLHTRKIRNFHRPFDTAQHDANCGLKNEHTREHTQLIIIDDSSKSNEHTQMNITNTNQNEHNEHTQLMIPANQMICTTRGCDRPIFKCLLWLMGAALLPLKRFRPSFGSTHSLV
jgi:hypothetical protein